MDSWYWCLIIAMVICYEKVLVMHVCANLKEVIQFG